MLKSKWSFRDFKSSEVYFKTTFTSKTIFIKIIQYYS